MDPTETTTASKPGSPRGRRPRHGAPVVAKSVTFNPEVLERLSRLADRETRGNVSECANQLIEEALDTHEALAAIDDMAAAMKVELTEELAQRATAWLLETQQRIARKRALTRKPSR